MRNFNFSVFFVCLVCLQSLSAHTQIALIVKPSINVSWFNNISQNVSTPSTVIVRPGFGINLDCELSENIDFGFGLEWNKIGGPIGILKSFEGSDSDTLLNLSFDNVKQIGLVERYITVRSLQIPLSFKVKKQVSDEETHWFRFGTNLNYNFSAFSTDRVDYLYYQNPNTKEYANSTRTSDVYRMVDVKENVSAFTMDLLFGLGVDVQINKIDLRVGVNYHQGLMNMYSDRGIEKDGLGNPIFSGLDNSPEEFNFSFKNNFAELYLSVFAF
jgi:hypothetical protein